MIRFLLLNSIYTIPVIAVMLLLRYAFKGLSGGSLRIMWIAVFVRLLIPSEIIHVHFGSGKIDRALSNVPVLRQATGISEDIYITEVVPTDFY